MAEISEEDFYARYRPIGNPAHGGKDPCYEWGENEVRRADIPWERAWAAVEGDNDSMSLVPGYHKVNVLYFMVTEEPWPRDMSRGWDVPVPWTDENNETVWVSLIDEHGTCDICGEHYELSDPLDHCAIEGLCWNHCTEPEHKEMAEREEAVIDGVLDKFQVAHDASVGVFVLESFSQIKG